MIYAAGATTRDEPLPRMLETMFRPDTFRPYKALPETPRQHRTVSAHNIPFRLIAGFAVTHL